MSYSELYKRVQAREPKISSRWLRDEVISITSITKVCEQWTGVIDSKILRGFWIEGPLGPPVPLLENEALIVLPRGLDKPQRRFVYTKELMHAFDEPEEKADTPEKFDLQVEKFGDPSKDTSPMFRAEAKAFWRALGVLCPEKYRLEAKQLLLNNEVDEAIVASRLKIPVNYVRELMRDEFEVIIKHVMA